MSRKTKRFAAVFAGTCACGVFVALAGGVEWGTAECGGIATVTFICALVFGWLASE